MIKILFLIITFIFIIQLYIHNYNSVLSCQIKNKKKKKVVDLWNSGNYIDLGANSGDSLLWFYNLNMPNIKYTVPYPNISFNIYKNFNTYIFEANPFLCQKIYEVVKYIKKVTKLVSFQVYCPIIVSTYDGTDVMTIANDDVYSSKYYSSNNYKRIKRKNYTLPVLNFTRFVLENIPLNNFNVMKFDIEGEEHYVIPDLIEKNLLNNFDILYSEFHKGIVNNPLKEKAYSIFSSFLNYCNYYKIDSFEERNISKFQLNHYLDIIRNLHMCKRNTFFK